MFFTGNEIPEFNMETGMNIRLLAVSLWVCPPHLEWYKYSNLLCEFDCGSILLCLEIVKCGHKLSVLTELIKTLVHAVQPLNTNVF